MKRLILAAAAAGALALPLAATPAQAQVFTYGYSNYDPYYGYGGSYGYDPYYGYDQRYARRQTRREMRRWDSRRDNGYYYGDNWYYGAPPANYGYGSYYPGYQPLSRGGYLPPYYRDNRYVMNDYGRYGLRAPPRGYSWYRAGNDFALSNGLTGIILDLVLGGRF